MYEVEKASRHNIKYNLMSLDVVQSLYFSSKPASSGTYK